MKKVLLILVAAVVVLVPARFLILGVENWMRDNPRWLPPAWQIRRQAVQLSHTVIADDGVGFVLPPHEHDSIETDDYSFERTTDAAGFPNPGAWPERADIVFLGDSLLLGEGVGVDGSFVHLVDERLANEPVVNLGSPGAGLRRQLAIYRRFGAALEPRLVVACIYLASDLMNDVHFEAWLADPKGMEYNRFRLSYSRRTEHKSGFDIVEHLEGHPLYSWARSVVEPMLWGRFRIPHRGVYDGWEYFFDREKVEFAREPAGDYASELGAFAESLTAFQKLVSANESSELAVVLIPSKEEIFALPGEFNPGGVVAAVRAMLAEKSIPSLDLYPPLQAAGAAEAVYFKRDIHLNQTGNRVVADAFVDWFNRRQDQRPSAAPTVTDSHE